jgi:hypothetical protein
MTSKLGRQDAADYSVTCTAPTGIDGMLGALTIRPTGFDAIDGALVVAMISVLVAFFSIM